MLDATSEKESEVKNPEDVASEKINLKFNDTCYISKEQRK